MTTTLDMDTRVRAIRNLARTRVDREGGPGSYQSMLDLILAGGAASAPARRALEAVHARAERNLLDVLAALAEAGGARTDIRGSAP